MRCFRKVKAIHIDLFLKLCVGIGVCILIHQYFKILDTL